MSILKRTLKEHISALRGHEYSAEELCRAYLSEILRIDRSLYGAYLHIDEKAAIAAAKKADKLLASKEAPLLCGIPYAAKDNICTKGIPTTAASKILSGFIPPYDATAIERLKKNGAVLLGKTNMDEFAMGSATGNSAFHITKNPANTTAIPGGSSGGSAAAVAAGIAPFALGSDTGGSVRQPAALCGTVGLCPTYGAVSRYGLIAFASSLDRIGILSKTCDDCKTVFFAIAGKDKKDSTSAPLPKTADLLSKDLKGLRIGIAEELFCSADDAVRTAVLKGADKLSRMGFETVSVSLPSIAFATEAYYIISSAEASSNLARYDGVRFGKRADGISVSLDEFYKRNRSEGFGDEVKRRIMLGTFVLSEGSYESYYKKALQVRELIKEDYEKAFQKCDIIISPTSPTTARPIDEKRDDPTSVYAEDICTVSQSLAGLPALSLPCLSDGSGMPIGMQLTGKPFSEALLLSVGAAFEKGSL